MLSILFRRLMPAICLVLLLGAADAPVRRSPLSKGRPDIIAPSHTPPRSTIPRKIRAKDAEPVKETPPIVVRHGELSPAQFLGKVKEAGGRADFVFEDTRPFAECHASTIVESANGQLLCAWFGGTKEKDDDVAIWLSRFAGGVWSQPQKVVKVNETAHWNPVLFRAANSAVYLFFKVGREIPLWETCWMETKDDGHTWSKPVELVKHDQGGRGPVKNKPIVLSDGTWVAGASTEYK
ncbi:MAG: exo-alpha-sialidase, partial [Candidatus Hydrogenedentes bacterium]|nr:exo-alpha-sialidase [Candidatus Hydrogenedentota bacterium]